MLRREKGGAPQAIQGPPALGLLPGHPGHLLRHQHIVDGDITAARALEPEHLPGVMHRHLGHGDKDHARFPTGRRCAATEPRRVADPAGKGPTAAHPVASRHRGRGTPAAIGVREPVNTWGSAAGGRNAPASPMPVPQINKFQPAVGWMRLTASITSICSSGSASYPPSTVGSFSPYKPAAWKASTAACASVPAASLVSRWASSVARSWATASSNACRVAPRAVGAGGTVVMLPPSCTAVTRRALDPSGLRSGHRGGRAPVAPILPAPHPMGWLPQRGTCPTCGILTRARACCTAVVPHVAHARPCAAIPDHTHATGNSHSSGTAVYTAGGLTLLSMPDAATRQRWDSTPRPYLAWHQSLARVHSCTRA